MQLNHSRATTRPQSPPARRETLAPFFAPGTIAVIGASETAGSVGEAVASNLRTFDGAVYPVNPRRASVFGVECFPNIAAVHDRVDLAVIATPAATVPTIVSECGAAGVPAIIILSAGFKECGAAGAEMEQQVLAEARRHSMRIIGPNCLGVMVPHLQLNASFAATCATPGPVAFLSQSGALCTAVLDWSLTANVGFSAFISVGSMMDVGWADLISFFGNDPRTKSILIYMESIGDAGSFLSAAREVALTKPIIVVKVGRTEAGARAAASHTGSVTGSDGVLDAAFRRAGVLRVNDVEELFDMAEVLAKQPRPHGPMLTIVTNGGGPGALAADFLVATGGRPTRLSAGTLAALDSALPPHWSHGNPVDVLGDASPALYGKATTLALADEQTDGVLAILTPQAMTDATGIAEQLKICADQSSKPILACWMGGPAVQHGKALLDTAGVPTFEYPERAVRAFTYMSRYSANLAALHETPVQVPASEERSACRTTADDIISAARKAGRTLLTEVESKRILAAYGIPAVETRAALTEDAAVAIAQETGYPVAVKLLSETLTHKTDVDGVHLGVSNANGIRHAWRTIKESVSTKAGHQHFLGVTVQPMITTSGYELILGSSIDADFGPVLLFGAGGRLIEIFHDCALELPPLNTALAMHLVERTQISEALKGVRGRSPVNLAELVRLLVRFSELIVEQRWIKEMDVNPLLACPDRLMALDARIVLHNPATAPERLPKAAIRPYPSEYVSVGRLKDGTVITIRPVRPEDEPLMAAFERSLSDQTVYWRYFGPQPLEQRVAHERLARSCFIDYNREIVMVAEHVEPNSGPRRLVGTASLSRRPGVKEAEFAVEISDGWQNRGLGTQLLSTLVNIGRAEKLTRITGTILADNRSMLHVARKVGFTLHQPAGGWQRHAELVL